MANKHRSKNVGAHGSAPTLNEVPVRPPGVPSVIQHRTNLQKCALTSDALARWLDVPVHELVSGENPLIRLAVAYYLVHKSRVVLSRLPG